MLYLIVFLGAGIGGALRHAVNVAAVRVAGYGFPFGTLTVTFNSIAHKLELPPYDSVFTRLEAVYLAVWNGVAPPADLERVARIARVLGCIGRALAWERSLIGLKDDEMDGFGDGVAGWLVEFASRLGRFTATR